jgi:hypothetical protein
METIQIGDHKVSMDDFNKWLGALRSGKYKQGHGKLETSEGLCCLGVGCKVFIPKESQTIGTKFPATIGILLGTLPTEQANSPDWLKEINVDFNAKTASHLFDLNDSMRLSFDEIADCLEAVYIHKVLE